MSLAAPAPAPVQTPYDDPTFFSQPILMQGQSPECGGYSLAFALAYLLNQQVSLSGSFAYAYEKTQDGVPDVAGTTINAVGQTGHFDGTCLDSLFPTTVLSQRTPRRCDTIQGRYASSQQDSLTRNGWIPLFLTDLSWNGIQAAINKYKAVILAEVRDEWYSAPDGATSWAAEDILPVRPRKCHGASRVRTGI